MRQALNGKADPKRQIIMAGFLAARCFRPIEVPRIFFYPEEFAFFDSSFFKDIKGIVEDRKISLRLRVQKVAYRKI